MITKEKWKQLHSQLALQNIKESDIQERFILGSGRGGQKQQKSHNCVQLKHVPTGITVKCHSNRLRVDNRFFARRRLLEKITSVRSESDSKLKREANRVRRQKKRRSRRSKQKILDTKKNQSTKKILRMKPSHDE